MRGPMIGISATTKIALSAALTAGTVAPALADAPGKGWMPIDQVLRRLSEAGYGEVRSIEADDGGWKGKVSRDGRSVKVWADPRTGTIVEKGARQGKDQDKDKSED